MYKIGVDLGGTNIVSGVVDSNYNIIGKASLKTNAGRPAKEIFKDIISTINSALENAKVDISEIASIGIGTPGSVNKASGRIEYANNLDFHKVNAVSLIHEQIPNIPVYLENDANCAALGEALAGAGKGRKSFVAVTLGTGVGSGYILDGKIISGCNDAGGEFGHIVIDFDGEQCNCGRQGCWEAYASATALIRQTKESMLSHEDSVMWQIADGDLNNVSARTSFDAMRAGDQYGKELVQKYLHYVAVGTINIVNSLQPDVICFGGGISNEGETLLAPIRDEVQRFRYSRYAEIQTELVKAELGNEAGIIGAAMVEY